MTRDPNGIGREGDVDAAMTSEVDERAAREIGADRTLLIVEDDKPFLTRLARAMEGRGFVVDTAESVAEAVAKVRAAAPAYAVIDMRLGDGNGLDVVEAIREKRADSRAIVLTGYGNIATAVTAVKLGAVDYLSKPSDADDIYAALTRTGHQRPVLRQQCGLDRVGIGRLRQVVDRTRLHRGDRGGDVAVAGQHDDARLWRDFANDLHHG